MVPKLGQRLLIAGTILLGGLVWWTIRPWLAAGDANGGISLFQAHIGLLPAVALVVIAGIPAVALSVVVSGTGHPLSGVFTAATSLLFLAGAGGGIQGVLWRGALPGEYGWLMLESVWWGAGVICVVWLIASAGGRVRDHLPSGWRHEHLGQETRLALPGSEALVAGLVAAAVGGLITDLFMQSPGAGQAIGSLLFGFTIAGLLAQMIVPQNNPVAVLISPIVVGVVGYGYVLLRYPGGDAILAAYYARTLPGLAMILPIFYASAGVAGAALGVGLAQAIEAAREPLGGEEVEAVNK